MPAIALHPVPAGSAEPSAANPLPQLLQTPSGLAIIELQGTINLPSNITSSFDSAEASEATNQGDVEVGRLVFPLYKGGVTSADDTKWMKRVYLYVGRHQRMTGEVKKLAKPLAVVRRRGEGGGDGREELEIAEVVRFKVLFASRPEPVGVEER